MPLSANHHRRPRVSQRGVHFTDVTPAQRCADFLERARATIMLVLTKHESHEAAKAEIDRSIDALRNVHGELTDLGHGSVDSIAVFPPITLPLSSLVLFAAIPSLVAGRVDVRLPASTREWFAEIAAAAQFQRFFPRMHLHTLTPMRFMDNHASHAEVVTYSGRYEAAEHVRAQCPESLFIYRGSGVNPIVIGAEARITDDDIERIITARVFNAGQDSAAPDALLVHASVAAAFVAALVDRVEALSVGTYDDPSVRIGRILNAGPLGALEARFDVLRPDIVLGGRIDYTAACVEPTVVVRPMSEHDELTEFFAPVFYVLVYEDDAELRGFFARPEYRGYAMKADYVALAEPARAA